MPLVGNNVLFRTYNASGPSAIFIIPSFTLTSIGLIGIFFNFSIIYVTAKYRILRSTSSFLLAFTALAESIHQLGHLLYLVVALAGINFVPYSLAFQFLLGPFVAMCTGQVSIAMTGVDRLAQLVATKWHNRLKGHAYLTVLALVALGIGHLPSWKFADIAQRMPTFWETGLITYIFLADFIDFFVYYMLAIHSVSAASYAGIWLIVRRKQQNSLATVQSQQNFNARLFRSLLLIFLINIGGYAIWPISHQFLYKLVLTYVDMDQIPCFIYDNCFSILLNLSVALNAPVLYFSSQEYRKCFNRELVRIRKCLPQSIQISSFDTHQQQQMYPNES